MEYEITTSDCKTYLHIRVNEPVTADLLYDFIGKTAQQADTYRIDHFLFDLRRADNRTDVFSHYDMAYHQAKKMGFKTNSKHALLVIRSNKDDYAFVETILNNAGYQSRMFTDEISAIEWLEK